MQDHPSFLKHMQSFKERSAYFRAENFNISHNEVDKSYREVTLSDFAKICNIKNYFYRNRKAKVTRTYLFLIKIKLIKVALFKERELFLKQFKRYLIEHTKKIPLLYPFLVKFKAVIYSRLRKLIR